METDLTIRLTLPSWLADARAPFSSASLAAADERMEFVLDLARQNVAEGTGGPFAAAVFDDVGSIVGVGVNLVVPSSAPIAHAEIVAIAHAGQQAQTWDLASVGAVELVSSTEPCAMCLGAVPWSGVKRLVCGARDSDARDVGFDEGDKPEAWVDSLKKRGIDVVRDVRRDEAAAVLGNYAAGGGDIYNGSSS